LPSVPNPIISPYNVYVPETLLQTKLFIPPLRPNLVPRPQLIERLNQGLQLGHKLFLISAPAGFGKTTLVSEWVAGCERPAAWLSLDEGDNDLTHFLTYLVAALQTLALSEVEGIASRQSPVVNIGKGVLVLLKSPQPPPIESILTVLLNEITTVPDKFILVLDDYYIMESSPVDNALTFLLEHLPPQMHLVIATREDPNLPLARLRGRGQLTELRISDLRFAASEAAAFLNQVMGLNLSAEDIATLETRTEGWIAGLQLAAISMQGHKDATNLIKSFTGRHHFVMDYLVEEILQQQSQSVQIFLLRTSILDRLCGSLCDAVLLNPSPSGQETLEYLEQANLFIVPLDDERRWYRYHHLFADLLRQRLHQSTASFVMDEEQSVAELHKLASTWHEDNGLDIEAFLHAVAANDVEHAARLVEGEGMPLHLRGALTPVLNWLASLPKTVLDARPSLWVMYGSALLLAGQLTSVEKKLQAAEAALGGTELDDKTKFLVGFIASARAALSSYVLTGQPTGVERKLQAAEAALQDTESDEKTQELVGLVTPIRVALAINQHQVETVIVQSRRALEYLHPDNPFRITPTWLLGVAYQLQGDRAAASQAYTKAISMSQAVGAFLITIPATIGLGNVQEAENQLYLAAESYRRGLQLGDDQPLPIACEAYLGLARIFYEWNDLDAAQQHRQQSLQLARQLENTDNIVSCELFLARLKLAQGDFADAAAVLAEVDQFVRQHNFMHRMPEVAAAQVRTSLHQGKLAAAAHLAEKHDLPISQARVHLAQGDMGEALASLDPLRQQVEAKDWRDERLKIMVLQAVAHHAHGEKDKAVQLLGDALALAEPGGFIRTFVDEGSPMAQLLSEVTARGIMPDYIAKLLAIFEAEEQKSKGKSYLPPAQPLIEPLSQRELEVLQLIAQGLSNREISERLYIALDTVKSHNRNIFSKLDVKNRTQAIGKARSLRLLPQ
jgi:LuxR family maltose regulon positive regulatory protein